MIRCGLLALVLGGVLGGGRGVSIAEKAQAIAKKASLLCIRARRAEHTKLSFLVSLLLYHLFTSFTFTIVSLLRRAIHIQRESWTRQPRISKRSVRPQTSVPLTHSSSSSSPKIHHQDASRKHAASFFFSPHPCLFAAFTFSLSSLPCYRHSSTT